MDKVMYDNYRDFFKKLILKKESSEKQRVLAANPAGVCAEHLSASLTNTVSYRLIWFMDIIIFHVII